MITDGLIEYINIGETWNAFAAFLPRFIAGMLVFASFYLVYQATVILLKSALERKEVHSSIINLTIKTYKYILIIIGVFMSLSKMGVQVGAALTGLGIVGVAIGFAARDSVSNYISGVTIFWDKPFTVGDYIEIQGHYGRVTEITMRSTRIRTLQNQYLIVPNQDIVNEMLINHSKNGEVRVEIPFSIGYHCSINQTRDVLLALISPDEDQRLSQYLRPTLVVSELGDNGIHLLFRIWVNRAEDEMAIRLEYLEKIKGALDEAHITIPYPQRVLHMENNAWQEKLQIPPLRN